MRKAIAVFMNSKNEKPKKAAAARLSALMSFPEDTLGGVSCVTLLGGSSLIAERCTGIIEYSEEYVSLRMCDGILNISGRFLTPECFDGGTVKLSGAVTSVEFKK